MYRQVRMHPNDTTFQRILWRHKLTEPVKEYKLQTVTYGTASASFLALRCLKQLAIDESSKYPLASKALESDFYVDDLMSGNDTVEEAEISRNNLIELLKSGGFELRKWSSNSKQFMESTPLKLREMDSCAIDQDLTIKTLGLNWNPAGDYFFFDLNLKNPHCLTKRGILSEISKIFDPVGWITPCTVKAKILIQKLWISGVHWDEPLPTTLRDEWEQLRNDFCNIQRIKIPRWIGILSSSKVQLLGFADASELAYGACVYARILVNGEQSTYLLMGKSKVAPIKQISLPKLELCAAHLLSKMVISIKASTQWESMDCLAYTDSMVVLHWLAEILDVLPYSKWGHVKSKSNPADVASRGVLPSNLVNLQLWWNGPDMEATSTIKRETKIKEENIKEDVIAEIRTSSFQVFTEQIQVNNFILERYSSLDRLLRISAWCFRFAYNCKEKDSAKRQRGYLSTSELNLALSRWILLEQNKCYQHDIQLLLGNKQLPKSSQILNLNPFVDQEGLVRVRGRIREGLFLYDKKHPYILSKSTVLSKLIVSHYHRNYLHAGPQLLNSVLREKFWIIRGKDIVRACIHKCITCRRHQAQQYQQQMGNLPRHRMEIAKPFTNTGLDYAGPLTIRSRKGRAPQHSKCYIALFICLSTRAIHLELVSDLTGEAVIAALKRFLSRRGSIKNIFSDNGTNFVRAARDISDLFKLFNKSENLHRFLSRETITWHFIPPHSPHFGGMWEAGVKSVKFHLNRVAGQAVLTFEELYTLLCQIENCLNSRPLTPLSEDINDMEALTPMHLLTGGATLALPEETPPETISYQKRWTYVQKIHQQFWKRWNVEFLHQLQKRNKWLKKGKNIQINDLTLVKEDNIQPGRWILGRVIQVFPGKDKLVRVATIRTKSSEILRS